MADTTGAIISVVVLAVVAVILVIFTLPKAGAAVCHDQNVQHAEAMDQLNSIPGSTALPAAAAGAAGVGAGTIGGFLAAGSAAGSSGSASGCPSCNLPSPKNSYTTLTTASNVSNEGPLITTSTVAPISSATALQAAPIMNSSALAAAPVLPAQPIYSAPAGPSYPVAGPIIDQAFAGSVPRAISKLQSTSGCGSALNQLLPNQGYTQVIYGATTSDCDNAGQLMSMFAPKRSMLLRSITAGGSGCGRIGQINGRSARSRIIGQDSLLRPPPPMPAQCGSGPTFLDSELRHAAYEANTPPQIVVSAAAC